MSTTTHTTTQYITYAGLLAEGLVRYADTHEVFATVLHDLLSSVPYVECPQPLIADNPLMPTDDLAAVRRVQWLIDTCTERRIVGHRQALATFTTWNQRRAYEEPKDLPFLLGVVVGVVPMIGMGRVPIKRTPMSILFRDDITHATTYQTLRAITTLTHRVVERGLIMAGGHTAKLEPELGDWLFGEKELAFYGTTLSNLGQIERHLDKFGVPYASEHDKRGVTLLACSPALSAYDLPEGEKLHAIE
jgi:hypothetical protein